MWCQTQRSRLRRSKLTSPGRNSLESLGTQIRLLSRAMKLLVEPGQSLFGALALENLRKGPARLHGTNLEI